MDTLDQYTLVAQSKNGETYTIERWQGKDLSGILGVTQPKRLPPGSYGWFQTRGKARVRGCDVPAFIDFSPNNAKLELEGLAPLPAKASYDQVAAREKLVRLSKLPPLLIEDGDYCRLLVEARDVFVDGHYYACVAMCGITFERLQRDGAKPYHPKKNARMNQIRAVLGRRKVYKKASLKLCKDMACLRNDYAHGRGRNPKQDAPKAVGWLRRLIDNETNLMRNYEIQDGTLCRKLPAPGTSP